MSPVETQAEFEARRQVELASIRHDLNEREEARLRDWADAHDNLPATEAIAVEIVEERHRQNSQWGGPAHDDQHSLRDWSAFITEHLGKALTATDNREIRERLIVVAALAVAAVEGIDRDCKPGLTFAQGLLGALLADPTEGESHVTRAGQMREWTITKGSPVTHWIVLDADQDRAPFDRDPYWEVVSVIPKADAEASLRRLHARLIEEMESAEERGLEGQAVGFAIAAGRVIREAAELSLSLDTEEAPNPRCKVCTGLGRGGKPCRSCWGEGGESRE